MTCQSRDFRNESDFQFTCFSPSFDSCLTNWLSLHELNASECNAVMALGADMPKSTAKPFLTCEVSFEDAWSKAAKAATRFFPSHSEIVFEVAANTIHQVCDAAVRPVTLWDSGRNQATVRLCYMGRAADILTTAHEFGHALHYRLNRGVFVPPILRETCAFLAELILLEDMKPRSPALYEACHRTWMRGNNSYLGRCAHTLDVALSDPAAPYNYDWNYPIARIIATEVFRNLDRVSIEKIFENQILLPGIVKYIICGRRNSPSCDGACLNGFSGAQRVAGFPFN